MDIFKRLKAIETGKVAKDIKSSAINKKEMKPIRHKDVEFLLAFANSLKAIQRQGNIVDEPEGTRFIVLSDTIAKQIEEKIRQIVDRAMGII